MLLRRAQPSTINTKEYDSLPSSTCKFKIIQIPLDLDVHPLAHDSSNAEIVQEPELVITSNIKRPRPQG